MLTCRLGRAQRLSHTHETRSFAISPALVPRPRVPACISASFRHPQMMQTLTLHTQAISRVAAAGVPSGCRSGERGGRLTTLRCRADAGKGGDNKKANNDPPTVSGDWRAFRCAPPRSAPIAESQSFVKRTIVSHRSTSTTRHSTHCTHPFREQGRTGEPGAGPHRAEAGVAHGTQPRPQRAR
jgi:hypothetical protein